MKADHKETLDKIILSKTGMSIEKIQKAPLDDLRKIFEEKNNAKMKVANSNLNLISHEEIEKEFEKIIKDYE